MTFFKMILEYNVSAVLCERSSEGAGDAAGTDDNTRRGFSVILALRGSCRGWRTVVQWGRAGVS